MVTTPLRIGVVGTHSTGKTTLLRRIEMELRALGITVARTPGRLAVKAAELGFPKLHNQSPETTEWLITSGIAAELQTGIGADVVLVDRAAPDPLAYYLAALDLRGTHDEEAAHVGRLLRLMSVHAEGYGLLLATVLDPDIPLGEHRDRDPAYRTLVDNHVHALISNLPHQRVTSADHDKAVRAAVDAATAAVAATIEQGATL